MTRAGITSLLPEGSGTLVTEPILLLRGSKGAGLEIYDQHGRWIGEARQIRTRVSRVQHRWSYEMRDSTLRCVLSDTTDGHWQLVPKSFAVVASDGDPIASATRSSSGGWIFERDRELLATLREAPREELRTSRLAGAGANPLRLGERFHDRYLSAQLFFLEGEPDRSIARITHLRTSYVGIKDCFVVELDRAVPEEQRLLAVTACVIANNTMLQRRQHWLGA